MKLRTLALAATLLIGCNALRAESYPFKEPFSKSGPFRGDASLTLENVNGAVEIRAWDKNEIRIDGEKSARTEEELKQIEPTMDVSEGHAAIKVRLPKRKGSWFNGGDSIRASVRFTINVPKSAAIQRLNVVNSAVTLEGLLGGVHVETVNGPIRAARLAGNANLETVNGSIGADFEAMNPDQKLTFKTVNGSITIKLPSDAGAKVRSSVVNGAIASDFPLTIEGSNSRRRLNGTIGDGRAALDVRTVNGGIKIARQ